MEPKEVEGSFVRMEHNRVNLIQASLCVNCWPVQAPSFFVWAGMSLCVKCFEPLRKMIDHPYGNPNGERPPVGIDRRSPYKATWGEEPVQDAEVL